MKRKPNVFKKNIVKQSYKILSMLVAYISASGLWYYDVSPYWEEGYTGYVTLFLVGVMFCAVYWVFAKMYQAAGGAQGGDPNMGGADMGGDTEFHQ